MGPEAAAKVVDLTGETALRETMGVLTHLSLFVGNDTGVSHIAASVGTPTVTLFGPTPALKWGNTGPHNAVITAPDGCMDSIAVAPVECAALDLLFAGVARLNAAAGTGSGRRAPIRRICVVRFGGMGDILLATPAVRALSRYFGTQRHRLHRRTRYEARSRPASLYLREVIEFDKDGADARLSNFLPFSAPYPRAPRYDLFVNFPPQREDGKPDGPRRGRAADAHLSQGPAKPAGHGPRAARDRRLYQGTRAARHRARLTIAGWISSFHGRRRSRCRRPSRHRRHRRRHDTLTRHQPGGDARCQPLAPGKVRRLSRRPARPPAARHADSDRRPRRQETRPRHRLHDADSRPQSGGPRQRQGTRRAPAPRECRPDRRYRPDAHRVGGRRAARRPIRRGGPRPHRPAGPAGFGRHQPRTAVRSVPGPNVPTRGYCLHDADAGGVGAGGGGAAVDGGCEVIISPLPPAPSPRFAGGEGESGKVGLPSSARSIKLFVIPRLPLAPSEAGRGGRGGEVSEESSHP